MTADNRNTMRRPEGRPLVLMTVAQAAEKKGVTSHAVRHAINNGRLPAQKIGKAWLLRPKDVEDWAPNPLWGRGKNKKREDSDEG